jgi:hypothetical protein
MGNSGTQDDMVQRRAGKEMGARGGNKVGKKIRGNFSYNTANSEVTYPRNFRHRHLCLSPACTHRCIRFSIFLLGVALKFHPLFITAPFKLSSDPGMRNTHIS